MTSIAVKEKDTQVARPLRVLVPLIKEDLRHADEAANRASLPYKIAAGEKMLEARLSFSEKQIAAGEFNAWIQRTFGLGKQQGNYYMRAAKESGRDPSIAIDASSLSQVIRNTINPNYNKPHTVRPTSWFEPVKQIADRVDTETLNLKRDELKRADEREAQRKLALQLIDIGYKVLARTLHPDKGGSREAMARLNAVRDRLKQCV